MQKTKIDWADYSWNPFKGRCPVRCSLPDGRIYCYGHKLYDRFEWMEEGTGDYGAFAEYELSEPARVKKPSKIFVCSTFELFYAKASKPSMTNLFEFERREIFQVIEDNPQHTFIILTKYPENIDRPVPKNVWLGISAGDDRKKGIDRMHDFVTYILWGSKNKEVHFLSLEPLLYSYIADISFEKFFPYFGWIIVGRLTGFGKEFDPPREDIQRIVDACDQLQIPIFLKNNLKGIWGEDLIQQYPGLF